MAIIPDRQRIVEYVPECDRDLDEAARTVFKIRPFTKRTERALVENESPFGQLETALKDSLVGWVNLKDTSGNDVEYDKVGPDYLPADLRMELFREIEKISTLTRADAKN